MRFWPGVLLAALLGLAACAGQGDRNSDNDQHSGFYGGVSGGWH